MFFQQVYDNSLAQASYVIACQKKGVAAVIDPKRDVDTYMQIAEENGFKITQIYETHIHADFLCGSRELKELTGATIYASEEGGDGWLYEFDHHALHHNDEIKLGNLTIKAIHTPGHTPEHMSFILTDHPSSDDPVMIFTGDFVFVGDVGRPDLLEEAAGQAGTKEQGAKDMFESLKDFQNLEDRLLLWPGHGAGSACGKNLGDVKMSTVGYEKTRNWALQLLNDEEEFKKELLSDQPEPPTYFKKMKELNKVERNIVPHVPKVKNLHEKEWNDIKNSVQIIDTRKDADFSKGHVKGSWNIMNNKSLSTWMGWLMDYDKDFVMVVNEADVEDVTRKLMRIGLDRFVGFITPEQLQTFEKTEDLETYDFITKSELKERLDNVEVLDVRNDKEFKNGHIDGAHHVFVGILPEKLNAVPKTEQPLVVHCQSGVRSAVATSYLLANGFDNVVNFSGGWSVWNKDLD